MFIFEYAFFPLSKKTHFLTKKCIFLDILTSFSSLKQYLCSGFRKQRLFNPQKITIMDNIIALLLALAQIGLGLWILIEMFSYYL